MSETFPGRGAQQQMAYGEYQQGDYSVAERVTVASASGSNDEKHASGSYGSTSEVLGGLVRRSGAL